MIKVGITGGIGSGKTTVCRIFETLGIPVYYADDRAKYLMNNDAGLKAQLIRRFGEEVYKNNELDRPFLARQVFNNPEALKDLNNLVHPAVARDSERWQHEHSDTAYTLKEAALLYESGSYRQLDKIIVVTAPLDVRVKRVMERDGVTRQEVLDRIKNQIPEEEKVARADYVINNDGEKSLIEQVLAIHHHLTDDI